MSIKKIVYIFFILLVSSYHLFSQDGKKNLIAIMDFESKGVEPSIAQAITELIGVELVKTKRYIVVERNQINKILQEQKFQISGLTENEAVRIGALLGVNYIIVGSVSVLGKKYIVSSRIINVETATIILAESISSGSVEELEGASQELIARMIRQLDVSEGRVVEDKTTTDKKTTDKTKTEKTTTTKPAEEKKKEVSKPVQEEVLKSIDISEFKKFLFSLNFSFHTPSFFDTNVRSEGFDGGLSLSFEFFKNIYIGLGYRHDEFSFSKNNMILFFKRDKLELPILIRIIPVSFLAFDIIINPGYSFYQYFEIARENYKNNNFCMKTGLTVGLLFSKVLSISGGGVVDLDLFTYNNDLYPLINVSPYVSIGIKF